MAADVKNDATLSTSLVSYWELEEASGTRVDSHGSNDLTDNNTVTSATGIQGDAASFTTANSEYLSKSSVSGIPSGSDAFSVSFWWKSTTNSKVPFEWGTSGSLVRIEGYFPANQFALLLNGGNIYWTATDVNNGAWHHVVATHAGGEINNTNTKGYMDDSPLSFASGNAQTVNISATPNLTIGCSGIENGLYVDGLIDEYGIWSKTLSSSEVTDLYNSGSGIPYDAGGVTFIPKVMMF